MWPTLFHLQLPFWPYEFKIHGYGLMLMIGFLLGTGWAMRRARRVKANPELAANCGMVALIASLVGARAFYVIHYWEEGFKGRGFWNIVNLTTGGLEFYGGFIAAVAALLAYLWWHRASLRLYLDILAPSLALGLAVTRIGCFLNGCCWGGPCPEHIPWAVRFPYLSPAFEEQWDRRMVALPAELISVSQEGTAYLVAPAAGGSEASDGVAAHAREFGLTREQLVREATQHRSTRLHPAQLYASTGAALLAVVLSTAFYRRKHHGAVFALLLILYPIMRFFEEIIRMDNPHDTAGLTVSQFTSVPILALGVGLLLVIRRLPQRSPKAVPYVPPRKQEAAPKRQPKSKGRRTAR